mgnify:CR=1 FL=1|tara:strand:+ start:228 stop:632 length:405 start_codon:yes stop_codon:yes gene_type:complete
MLELFPFSYVRFNKAKHDPKMTCKSLSVNSNRSDLTVSTSITAFENSMIVSIDLQDLDLEEYEQFSSDMAVFGGLSEGRTYWANNSETTENQLEAVRFTEEFQFRQGQTKSNPFSVLVCYTVYVTMADVAGGAQ